MWRIVLAFSIPAVFLAGLAGCAVNRFEARAPWRDKAESMCIARGLVQPTAYVSLGKEIDGPGPCGIQQPFKITRLGNGSVALKQRMTLGCSALAETEAWLADTIQPAANLYFGVPVTEINAGTYSCRGQNNQVGAKLSEHSYGNAIDIMSFKLADDHVITVKGGWRGTEAEQAFLREVFTGACARFTTVLAPGSNVFHYDHIHVDLARHDPRGLRRICKPLLKFEPQIGANGQPRQFASPRPPVRQPAPPQAPIDQETDEPYGAASSRGSASQYARAPSPRSAYAAAPPSRLGAAAMEADEPSSFDVESSAHSIY
ncbi:extensin family protein [Methylobacterium gnaphalii]|uniref:Extensin-like C-terminal domain-containing protein n=1 Tax=Methylobacterium gnaphalii TaxID=1010610 RepID=A0A512JEM6_9HYPH|nr:extensin family protein [Methylobacterium gnaphalii]GEP08406.1 hypothetical protein MGN01_02510 [Methylobacterium gnaphalii]GJD68882.1 hypothetical protein MMMDOFMJ_1807 [Methylobacterium gnaphalii]GLS47405.1 hypothetical protein GCM10007885_02490 [Methylobacterium gnaphalii]